MTFFDENGEYWGNKTKPIINAANGRLNARRSGRIFFLFFLALKFIRFSVKIFADGRFLGFFLVGKTHHCYAGALRTGGAAVHYFSYLFPKTHPSCSYMSHMLTTQRRTDLCAYPRKYFTISSLSFYEMDGKWSVLSPFLQLVWTCLLERACYRRSCERHRPGCV